MKKIGCIIVIILLVLADNLSSDIIADDAIRVRILANSNSEYDQDIKMELKDNVKAILFDKLIGIESKEEAEKIIIESLGEIDTNVGYKLESLGYDSDYKIEFGKNYFPKKKYKGVIYEEGEYDSLLITLGSGEGNNWWSVMFPPLCLLEENETEDVEYRSYILDLIKK